MWYGLVMLMATVAVIIALLAGVWLGRLWSTGRPRNGIPIGRFYTVTHEVAPGSLVVVRDEYTQEYNFCDVSDLSYIRVGQTFRVLRAPGGEQVVVPKTEDPQPSTHTAEANVLMPEAFDESVRSG